MVTTADIFLVLALQRIADKVLEEKVILLMKELVKLENKSVAVDEFNKLFE